jgi:transcriptional regulator with XRE-family HTH domain
MTQEQLATAAGLCRTFLNPLERGRHSATLETICTLAKALDVPPERLMLAETA